uniref:Ww domain-containing oxidoreductase n=1 Tax=Tetraselmis sp. GSL018 TaxID=582737 RepID=A0A061SEA7_9CHLO
MSTASEMLLAGKIALVTGATSGIGLETASALAGLGVTVILGARNSSKAEDVAELIRKRHQGAQVEVGPELDLKSLDSVRNFAAEYEAKGKPLHILVNNAGANFSRPWRTAEEVTGLVQVNYLGAFALTRLMEKQLVSSAPARVVNVSSITHRFVKIPDVHEFLYNWKKGTYAHTKLANVLFSRELHKRLHSHGVDSCAVDPGGVNSSIWDRGGIFSRPPLRNVIHAVYAPPSDGAKSVVHAAVAPWTSKNKYDHYTFARGMFANPLVTWNRGPGTGFLRSVEMKLFMGTALASSLLDWPLRWLSRHLLCSRTVRVASSPSSMDDRISSELWQTSCRIVSVPDRINT